MNEGQRIQTKNENIMKKMIPRENGVKLVELVELVVLVVLVVLVGLGMTSCNVTRTVTTKSEYIQENDRSIVIQTRTVESYDASKKFFKAVDSRL